jgi:hypothetical protein
MSKPDFIYDPEEWEYTVPFEDKANMADDLSNCEVKRFSTLIKGPDIFAARVPTGVDECGDVTDSELEWFDTLEAAQAAASPY